jgi:DNA-binding transcriptional LysR family regulator
MPADRTISDDRLRYLFESVRLGTMRAASEYLDVAPSSVSRRIASIEKELGVTLIEKGRHTVQLTGAGELVLQYYRDQRSHSEALRAEIENLKGLRTGHFQIALGNGLLRATLVEVLRDYMNKYPGIAITMQNDSTREVEIMTMNDYVHFGIIMGAPTEKRLRTRATIPQAHYLMASPQHKLSGRKNVDLSDLKGERLILPGRGFLVRQVVEEAQRSEGLAVNTVLTTSAVAVVGDLVAENLGLSILTKDSILDHLKAGRVVAVPLSYGPLKDSKAHIVVRIGRKLPHNVLRLLEMLEGRAAKVNPATPAKAESRRR